MRIVHTGHKIVHEVLSNLADRKGIRHVFDDMDEDIYEDMQRELAELVIDILFEEETR